MAFIDTINDALKAAMRSKDSLTLDTIRMAKSALKNKEIEKLQQPLTEAESYAVIQTLVKQRQESAVQYRSGGREELAVKEEKEIEILRRFLPQALSDAELEAVIRDVIAQTGAKDIKQMGLVIKDVMAKVAGRAEGAKVSAAVKSILGS